MSTVSYANLVRLLSVALAFAPASRAQDQVKRFESVSIRETVAQSEYSRQFVKSFSLGAAVKPQPFYTISDNRLDTDGILTESLISTAYGTNRLLVRGPAWIKDARFAIHAVMPAGARQEDVPEMLRAMLEDHFHLSVSRVTQPKSGFSLVRGKGPLHLNPHAVQDLSVCGPWLDSPFTFGAKRCVSGAIRSPDMVVADTDGPSGPTTEWTRSSSVRTEFFSADMDQFSSFLATKFTSFNGGSPGGYTPVHDATGIGGKWDFTLEINYGPRVAVGPTSPLVAAFDAYLRAIEKLGFRLEQAKVPVEWLRIEHIDRKPTGP